MYARSVYIIDVLFVVRPVVIVHTADIDYIVRRVRLWVMSTMY